eukprot:3287961-Prymnesium_polylepis.1
MAACFLPTFLAVRGSPLIPYPHHIHVMRPLRPRPAERRGIVTLAVRRLDWNPPLQLTRGCLRIKWWGEDHDGHLLRCIPLDRAYHTPRVPRLLSVCSDLVHRPLTDGEAAPSSAITYSVNCEREQLLQYFSHMRVLEIGVFAAPTDAQPVPGLLGHAYLHLGLVRLDE